MFSTDKDRQVDIISLLLSTVTYSSPILDYDCSVRSRLQFLGSQPRGDISHKPGGRLPLFFTRPVVTFPAKEVTPWPVPY